MVVIRLARGGAKARPFFNIVVVGAQASPTVERLINQAAKKAA